METSLGYIPNSSSKVRVFQSPEKKVTVDHILWYKTSQVTGSVLQQLIEKGKGQFMTEKKNTAKDQNNEAHN